MPAALPVFRYHTWVLLVKPLVHGDGAEKGKACMNMASRPTVSQMLDTLEEAYGKLAERLRAPQEHRHRLTHLVEDMHWYAQRLGSNRWEVAPRPGRWSFAENLWHITEQARRECDTATTRDIVYFIDHGKEHVGQAAEIFALFEYND